MKIVALITLVAFAVFFAASSIMTRIDDLKWENALRIGKEKTAFRRHHAISETESAEGNGKAGRLGEDHLRDRETVEKTLGRSQWTPRSTRYWAKPLADYCILA
jgi:hypothetical protein